MLQLIVENQRIIRNSFVLSQRVWSWNSIFWGWPASRRITWWPWAYLWSCECYHWRSWKKCFSESDETRKNCSVCESKINSLKDRISKALADDRISDEEFENILAEMSKYHELKKDIRVGFKKNKVKKTVENDEVGQLRREIRAEILKKTSLRRRTPKIEASCFCFLRRYDSGEVCDSGVGDQRPPPYNPDF